MDTVVIPRAWLIVMGLLLGSVGLGLDARHLALAADTFDLTKHRIPVEQILPGGPPKDGIPAILQPRFVLAEDAAFIHDDDLVVGVAGNGVAKAYPIRILNWHEVVNDTVGDQPVVVTWRPLTQSAIVFDRRVRGVEKTFGVSGRLYNSNVLMYDHQTESLWSQLQETAVAGPSTGSTLTPLPSKLVTWGAWKVPHPDTLVLSTETGYLRDYQRDPYASYLTDPTVMFPVNHEDRRLPAKAKVLGIVVNGIAKAYPLSRLKDRSESLRDLVGGKMVQVHVGGGEETGFVTDEYDQSLHAVVLLWFAWSAFHPETLLYE